MGEADCEENSSRLCCLLKFEGSACKSVQSPPLPTFRVQESKPFQTTGVDFAGPLHVRTSGSDKTSKVWIVLYACYST